jgi:hypothetical protein
MGDSCPKTARLKASGVSTADAITECAALGTVRTTRQYPMDNGNRLHIVIPAKDLVSLSWSCYGAGLLPFISIGPRVTFEDMTGFAGKVYKMRGISEKRSSLPHINQEDLGKQYLLLKIFPLRLSYIGD